MLKTWITGTKDFTDQGLAPSEWVYDNITIVDGGKLGKCMYFNGTSSRLSTTGYTLSNKWSWACWVKEDPSVTTWQCIIALNNNGSDSDMQTALWLKANEHRFEINNNTNYNSTIQYTQGQWNHYAVSFDGTTTKAYLNGNQVATFTSSSILSKTNLTIGARATNVNGGHTGATNYLKGYINDLRIWDDEVISPLQVKRLSQGLILHYCLDNNGVGGENLAINTDNKYEYTSSSNYGNDTWYWMQNIGGYFSKDIPVEANQDYVLSFDYEMTNAPVGSGVGIGTKKSKSGYDADTWVSSAPYQTYGDGLSSGHFIYHMQASSATNKYIAFRPLRHNKTASELSQPITIKIWNLKLEKGSKPTPWCPNSSDTLYTTLGLNDNIEYDTSGFGNNGTRVGDFSWSTDTPRYVASTHIGATTSKIHISNFPTSGFGNSYSFAWWGKRTSNAPMFWGFSDGIRLNGMYYGYLWNTGDGVSNPIYEPNTTTRITEPSLNVWHHYVMTGDGTTCKLYLDGELYGQAKTYKAISGTSIYINGWDSGASYCSDDTDISDFRIYATALSAEDVQKLYSVSALIDSQGNTYASSYVEE